MPFLVDKKSTAGPVGCQAREITVHHRGLSGHYSALQRGQPYRNTRARKAKTERRTAGILIVIVR
jgi:hypothetical protein